LNEQVGDDGQRDLSNRAIVNTDLIALGITAVISTAAYFEWLHMRKFDLQYKYDLIIVKPKPK
jgi:hypothetical protein